MQDPKYVKADVAALPQAPAAGLERASEALPSGQPGRARAEPSPERCQSEERQDPGARSVAAPRVSAKFDVAKANAAVLAAILPWEGRHTYRTSETCPKACGRRDLLTMNVWLRYDDMSLRLDTDDMVLNCFDLLFAGAVQAGVIDKKGLRQMYGAVEKEARQLIARETDTRGSPVGDRYAQLLVNRADERVMARWMGTKGDPVYSPGVVLRPGDVLVLGDKATRGGRHFAVVAEVGPEPMVVDILGGPVRRRPLAELERLVDANSQIFVLRNPWETLHKAGRSKQPMPPHPYGL